MQIAVDKRADANRLAFERLSKSDPVLIDIRRAGDFVPGLTPQTILTSGPPMPWADYTGGQREALIGGAMFESLASDRDEAIAKLDAGEIEICERIKKRLKGQKFDRRPGCAQIIEAERVVGVLDVHAHPDVRHPRQGRTQVTKTAGPFG